MIQITEKILSLDGNCAFVDFELDAFANLEIKVDLQAAADLEIVIGEVRNADETVNRAPGGYRKVAVMQKCLPAGKSSFAFDIPPHKSPYPYTLAMPVPPEAGGEIMPFRYVEINGGCGVVQLIRKEIYGDFDDAAADFVSSSDNLNRIWDFCKYSMKATGAFGVYIDGERERQPYEGDAFVNMLGDLCCGGSPLAAQRTLEWLLEHPTWFTEWQLLLPFILRDFYLYTDREADFKRFLPRLKSNFDKLLQAASEDSLLRDDVPADHPRNTRAARRDLVDWPLGERDNYEFGDVSLVPNCYWYGALNVMAELTGEARYTTWAAKVKAEIFRTMYRPDRGLFVDNPESEHTALHSAIFPIYFGLADDIDREPLKKLIRTKGMACSVYGAHFLIEICYNINMADRGLALMTGSGLRSYNNMLRNGATIAMEAWDNSLKPNQDWNHAWGAAPANLIPRCIAGIRPLKPGFAEFAVKPQLADLEFIELKHPTPYGAIELKVKDSQITLTVPEGTKAHFQDMVLLAGTHQLEYKK